jgi:hypothetical protein
MCEDFRSHDANRILIIIYHLCDSLVIWHMHSLRTKQKKLRGL